MKYLYGPVPSRRLGKSLGIDPFVRKICSHDCVYCQLGSAPPVSSEYCANGAPLEEIEDELKQFFQSGGNADYITFSGSGEPTLWKHIGELIQFIRKFFSHRKIAVITNATTLWREDVRTAITDVDLLVPTISAADEDTYLRLHRPHPQASFKLHIAGVKKIAEHFRGEIWAEIMLVEGVNDSVKHILELRKILDEVSPKYIDINTPVRPPSENWVNPPKKNVLRKLCSLLGARCRIAGKFRHASDKNSDIHNLMSRILDILRRRPETEQAIAQSLSVSQERVEDVLETLVQKKLIVKEPAGYYRLKKNS